ncbi:MAG: hypothetical protein ACRDJ3_06580 [Solirubrobacteraceae bacterium]
MSTPAFTVAPAGPGVGAEPVRVSFLGSITWLEGCCPTVATHGLIPQLVEIGSDAGVERAVSAVRAFNPDVTVLFVPASLPSEAVNELPGVTLGVLVGDVRSPGLADTASGLDRLVSFLPALTGTKLGATEVWRAVPWPVGDALYGEVRTLRGRPWAMSVGRSTEHREWMLMPAKHHHDLLQVIHGVSGPPLVELLREYDVGVYVSPEPGGAFGPQVGMHLAAGQLLLAEAPTPAHGLERNIDYLHIDSPAGLVWTLDRLARFPEMHQRIRLRGRLKAEQYRASRLFSRLTHDLLADVRVFGCTRSS